MIKNPLLIIQNDPEVPLGCYGHYLRQWQVPFRLLSTYAGEALQSAGDPGAIIVLGGAMGVGDTDRFPFLLQVKRFVAEAVEQEIPFLGICLGGQLLAEVLGANVSSHRFGEKGTLPVSITDEGKRDPLLQGISSPFITFQWHNDSFDLPVDATLLARSQACPHQAFRYGRHAYGTQFHPEVNAVIVDNWARWSDDTALRVDGYVSALAAAEVDYTSASRRLLLNFLSISGFMPQVL